ncbi:MULTISPECIES: hypothetical protein [unclassified Clostridium]|uniref:Lin0368 family putative glycerol transporter subunit n=1 Tax=unclassified Clostridium TaxID=2614128 RepID=UPI0002982EB4|nr:MULTISPECIES: hypothetical protein [unclassified Clostridium]EKQ51741.1 MAG: hypothetical protein A370_04726 [Clostridium sp. Maddingley MBC34-26]
MRFLRNTLGYCLAGFVINYFWGFFTSKLGVWGSYGAALFLTGSMWFLNHYLGLIKNDEDSAFIDMGLGVAISLVAKEYILHGFNSIVDSMPTLAYVAIGSALGGYVSVLIEKSITEKNNKKNACKQDNINRTNLELID